MDLKKNDDKMKTHKDLDVWKTCSFGYQLIRHEAQVDQLMVVGLLVIGELAKSHKGIS